MGDRGRDKEVGTEGGRERGRESERGIEKEREGGRETKGEKERERIKREKKRKIVGKKSERV